MGRSLSATNGNDCVQTPINLAVDIMTHFNPEGTILEPCRGDGNFIQAYEAYNLINQNLGIDGLKWASAEIKEGIDFLEWEKPVDWIITNPPYSIYRAFLNKAMDVADNIVFLQLINATFYKARLRDIKQKGFGIKEIWYIDTPKEFPQFGFQMGCVYYQRGYNGWTKIG